MLERWSVACGDINATSQCARAPSPPDAAVVLCRTVSASWSRTLLEHLLDALVTSACLHGGGVVAVSQ